MTKIKLTNFKEEMKKQIRENKIVNKTYCIGAVFNNNGDEFDMYEIEAEDEEKAVEIARQKVLKSFSFLILREDEEKRKDWCYIHNEEKDCYNEDGDHDDYHCRKCEIGVCPRCDGVMSVHMALSRRDNKTKICSGCGTAESMFELMVYLMQDDREKKILIEKEKRWLNK
ncbi:hypothetical protein LCGC14_0923200 [marine sediment metagenome]|uniref:Uncharacterized protein n=1 Tax=marine sediment metagenome TaxID=412755 RepID=A0A0F9NQ68_9ZZZZ